MTPVQTAKRIGRGTMKPGNWVQLFQFGLVGVSGYVVNLAVFATLVGPINIHHIPAGKTVASQPAGRFTATMTAEVDDVGPFL